MSFRTRREALLQEVAQGRPVKAIAVSRHTTPEAANAAIESLFVKLAKGVSAGGERALRRLRLLQSAIVDREEQGRDPEQAAARRSGPEAARRPRSGRAHGASRGDRPHVGRPGLQRHRRDDRPDACWPASSTLTAAR